jgi:hypothetical protein
VRDYGRFGNRVLGGKIFKKIIEEEGDIIKTV